MMKTIKFHELFLLSQGQRSAAHVIFDENATIITGATSSGKSCILKSLFLVFGASISKLGILLSENPYIFLKFSVDSNYFYILRKKTGYSVFNENGRTLITTTEVTKCLAPFLNELFDIRAKLICKKDNSIVQFLPGHVFSPFYIDQDSGWSNSWGSFSRVNFVKDYKKSLVDYFSGIKPLETYDHEIARLEAQQNLAGLNAELVATNKIRHAFNSTHVPATFNPDPSVFAGEIDSLTKECDVLLKHEQDKKDELSQLSDQLSRIELEIQAIMQLMGNLDATAVKALQSDGRFDCPLCGSVRDNCFEIAVRKMQDKSNYEELLVELTNRRDEIGSQKSIILEQLHKLKSSLTSISTILATKKENITLKDLIDEAGRRRYFVQLKSLIDGLQEKIVAQEIIIRNATKALRMLSKTNNKKEILKRYHELMLGFTSELDAEKITKDQLLSPYCNISSATGNENSRCLLAYFYTLITLSQQFAKHISIPIVIDTPLQQDPDPKRGQKVMNFLANHKPLGRQIIIATSKDLGISFGGKTIQMKDEDRYHLLKSENYGPVESFLRPFIQQHTDNLLNSKD